MRNDPDATSSGAGRAGKATVNATPTAATPTAARVRPGSRMFASFAVRNYRLFFAGALISNIGTWVQRIGQDWLVLTELTDHSSAALGLVTALQFLAIPFLAPVAGVVADRFSKREVLLVTQVLLGLNATFLWLLVATDHVQLWHVYLFALAQGIITSFDNPARQAFVSEIVSAQQLPNAVGLNSTSFNGARLAGPAAAGVMIGALGVAPTLLLNALSFLAMIGALVAMRPADLHPAPRTAARGALVGGLQYIARRPDIIMLMVIVFMLGTFGMNFQIYNATMATTVFGKGAEEFGLLGTVMAIGTLAGALLAARRARPRFQTILLSLAGFAICSVALALAPNYLTYTILLVPAGFFALTVMTSANASVQLNTEPEFRGRVMAVYLAIFLGGTPVGAPVIGWIGEQYGPRASVLIGAVVTGLTVVGVLGWLMANRGLRFRVVRRWPGVAPRWSRAEAVARDASAGEAVN